MDKGQEDILLILIVGFAALCVLGWIIGLFRDPPEDD
jgi:hypothetical protein